jgi:enamine deaminase RidA (YjgF/YER057c/UK114 family)
VPARRRPRRPGGARRRRAVAARRRPLRLPPAPVPGAQYVRAVEAGRLLFVSGHDPEAGGRLVYRGRAGVDIDLAQTRAAVRLATLNALASAAQTLGSLGRARRCLVLTCFVDGTGPVLDPAITRDAVRLIRQALGPGHRPLVVFRPAQGLAGGMPVEVELLLEVRARGG